MNKVCILGAGTWGTAIALLLESKGHDVSLWSHLEEHAKEIRDTRVHVFLKDRIIPDSIFISSDMGECARSCDLVVIAVPSHAVRETAKKLNTVIGDQPIVIISKGIEDGTLMPLVQVTEGEISGNPVAVMSGPSHAEEVSAGLPTTNVVACRDIDVAQFIQDIFMTPKFRVYTNRDVIGVELGGSVKNIIALCAGICDGLGFGDNTKAALMTRGLAEMARLGNAMGASLITFAGLSGIGDLIVTCTSMHSRNRRAGILIGQGKSAEQAQAEVKMVVEGIRTTKAVYELAKRHGVSMPIVEQAYNVLFCDVPALDAVTALMMRPKTHEEENIELK